MNTPIKKLLSAAILGTLLQAGGIHAQDTDNDNQADDQDSSASTVDSDVTLGLYLLDDDSFRFGKYSGMVDEGAYALLDFRWEKRPEWNSGDPTLWRFQGWRLGLDSRRLEFDWSRMGSQRLKVEYRQTPNNQFRDGMTPYQGLGSETLTLPSGWAVDPNDNWTRGFINLGEYLSPFKMRTERKALSIAYDLKIGTHWKLDIDYRHENKDGMRRTFGIFGSGWSSARSVEIPAPVDQITDNLNLMFHFADGRLRFGAGLYASFFNNKASSLTWQNAYSRVGNWDPSVAYPDGHGLMALEPDNRYLQFKAYGGMVFNSKTRLTADLSWGEMKQDDVFFDYTINPNLRVREDLPATTADAKVEQTHFNVRLTSRLLPRLNLVANYRYDDRDNKTDQFGFRYVPADSEDQVGRDGTRFNLPYSYRRQKADLLLNWSVARGISLKGAVDWNDYSRSYAEVEDAEEVGWLAGIRIASWQYLSMSLDYRQSDRDVDEYVHNRPFQESYPPGVLPPDAWQNHPWQRKFNQTDRERKELRFRLDWFPVTAFNLGFTALTRDDDYSEGLFGLNEAESSAWTVDFAWTARKNIVLSGFYTSEEWDSSQSGRTMFSFTPSMAWDDRNDWWVDTEDEAQTWNLHLDFKDLGENERFALGFDYTVSNVDSVIDVLGAENIPTLPLPALKTDSRSFSVFGSFRISERSSLVARVESAKLDADDFALDNVEQDTLLKVLTLGQSTQDYDLLLISAYWNYRF